MKMKDLLLFVEKKLVIPLEKISKQRHLVAVRDGLVAVFPLSLIGSFFLLVTTLPLPEHWPLQQFISAHAGTILIPYRLTLVLITLYLVVSIGASLAGYYQYSPMSGGIVALASFLMTQMPMQPSALVPQAFLTEAASRGMDTSWMGELEALGWVLPQAPMSGIAVFVGALAAIIGVEVLHLCNWFFEKRSKKKKKPQFWAISQIPESVRQTLRTILPILLVVVLMFIVRDIIGFDMQKVTLAFFGAFIGSVNSLPGAMGFALLMSLFGFFGIIGYSVSNSAASLTWQSLLMANTVAHASASALPNVAPLPFFHFFIWMGGIGSTLSLVVLLCFSKSRYLRRLGQSSLLPSLFNINTPVIYGLPIILNPYMLIPFTMVPVLTTFISYLCLQIGVVGRPYNAPSSSLPSFAGAFIATGDWKAILLCLLNFGVGLAVYLPFFRMYEKKLLDEGEEKAAWEALDEDEATVTTVE